MWEKIESFLFDILGLLVPGIVLILGVAFSYFSLISSDSWYYLTQKVNNESIIVINHISILLERFNGGNFLIIIIFLILLGYLLGHIVKVFSKIYYGACIIIFDNGIIELLKYIWASIKKSVKDTFRDYKQFIDSRPFFEQRYKLKKMLNFENKFFKVTFIFVGNIFKFILGIFSEALTFKVDSYEPANEKLVSEVVGLINQKYEVDFPKKWYSVYKLSKTIITHENLKSLGDTFLAKYNLYRSLSFISFLNIVLTCVLYFFLSEYLNPYANILGPLLLIIHLLFLFTFHEKYKRYFKLCGNETLIALFYFFKKQQ
ncbi:hypothetical protein P9173_07575 [Bacillus safensis]|uniref:hypothetical protein n=1 Tax=Bacillus safensis TaxID=561879 RepID=UPI00227E2838|nr:hypothetical protein [Bacillus safensis]MCY7541622.1 hypothetical protein [Bacillus safensis]MCY7551210.1 hypothetical protein [Bacillus safensis]MCY7645544.1 hypothetical protein [Bacillus safensis]MCY7654995.1 hypothetical protein [Bacillus safensis]MEC3710016.1 hypothetical protein [Bacillus safensis]